MDFAPNVTCRYKATYKACGFEHNIEVRFARGTTAPSVVNQGKAFFNALATAILPLMPTDFAWTAAHYALEDSDVFLPDGTKPTVQTGPVSLANYTAMMKASPVHFPGAGGGSKAGLFLYGPYFDPSDIGGPADNGRIEAAEESHIGAAIAAIQAINTAVSIANFPVTWYPYATYKVNDYWLRLVRKLFP